MRRLKLVCAAALAASAASSAVAASDFYLKIGDVKGEVAGKGDDSKGGWIEIQSFQWGAAPQAANLNSSKSNVTRAMAVSDPGASGPKGAAISNPPDRGSLKVDGSFPGCAAGTRYAGAQFAAGSMRYELKDVVITSCAAGGLTLEYGRVKYNSSPPTDR